jgi:RNA polymerase sigma-70 factor (ECF subfamily)
MVKEMNGGDTTLGGPDRFLPETTAGFRSLLRDGGEEGYRAALEVLCSRYWKPIYAYVRAGWSRSNEDAKDLTQAFFLWLQENGALRRFDEARGGLRPYLKILLRRFVKDKDAAVHRLKRGGGVTIVPLGDTSAVDALLADPRAEEPDAVFERIWRVELVEQAVERLRERCRLDGRAAAFAVFEAYDLCPEAERPTYKVLAERFGLGEGDVKRHLLAMRDALLEDIRGELGRLTATDQDRDDEWSSLLGP